MKKRRVGCADQSSIRGERWRPVPDFDGYEVSNMGRVRSLRRKRKLILKAARHSRGYLTVWLGMGMQGLGTSFLVHRLVLEAFVGPRPAEMCAHHKDGDPTNNKLSNLEWCTGREIYDAAIQRNRRIRST